MSNVSVAVTHFKTNNNLQKYLDNAHLLGAHHSQYGFKLKPD